MSMSLFKNLICDMRGKELIEDKAIVLSKIITENMAKLLKSLIE